MIKAMKSSPDERFQDVTELGAALLPFASPRNRAVWAPLFDKGAVAEWETQPPMKREAAYAEPVPSSAISETINQASSSIDIHPPDRKRAMLVGGVAFCVLAAFVLFLAMPGGDDEVVAVPVEAPKPKVAAPEPKPAPKTYEVGITVSPSTAKIFIDGDEVGTGRYAGTMLKDGRTHELEVRADGYVAHEAVFTDVAPPARDLARARQTGPSVRRPPNGSFGRHLPRRRPERHRRRRRSGAPTTPSSSADRLTLPPDSSTLGPMLAKRFLLAALVVVVPQTATAADSKEIQKLIDEGLDLREKQKDREALKKFEEAFTKSGSGRAQAQMALAHQALGGWLAAEQSLSAALKTSHEWIAKNRAALQGALETIRERLGRVEVNATVKGATVKLNGREVGKTPLDGPVYVVAGSVIVQAEADGHYPVSRQIDVAAGALARENIKLVKKTTAGAPPPPAPPSGGPPPPTSQTTAKTNVDGQDSPLPLVGYGLAGGAAIAVGVGVAFLFVRNGKIDEYNDDACLAGGKTREENCGDVLDSANSAGTLSTVSFIAGGVLAAGAVVMIVLGSSGGESTAAIDLGGATLACGPGPGTIGAGCALGF